MKVLLLVPYYNRPKLLRAAMESVRSSNDPPEWEMLFVDDGSPIPGEPIVREALGELQHRVTFTNTDARLEDKLSLGIQIGKIGNAYIAESDADIAVTLCDDDQLMSDYLRELEKFYENNPNIVWSYSHIGIWNPVEGEKSLENVSETSYNRFVDPINPKNLLDASQVSYRMKVFREGVRFLESSQIPGMPWAANPDADIFEQIYSKYGQAVFNGLLSQWKGIHEHQLVWHKKQGVQGLRTYIEDIHRLGGTKL